MRRLSPDDAARHLAEDPEFAVRRIPCARTWYKHVDHGDVGVMRGETPCQDDAAIKAVVGRDVFCTRAYASYEKGSVENCSRLVRRRYPKGTGFARVSKAKADVRRLEAAINGIHRLAPGGKGHFKKFSRG